MSPSVYPIKLGLTTCYLIKDKGVILFDAGMPRKINRFNKSLAKIPVDPTEISLIILSHSHFDHAGTAKDIREFTGARILVHRADEILLEQSKTVWPKGVTTWGRISAFIFKIMLKRTMKYPGTKPDIVMDTEEFSLREYGGIKVVYPAHGRPFHPDRMKKSPD
ncbi:MAG TPA: MBL fold metallo-hydrolase [Bacteroidales bacterium]|nr:MBL fold metallo-hydrolase [Bacteroidales bacterium]HRZ20289.1 MBL fold metallo-hydrolase [Bacteroidales bacterium]